MNKYYKYLKYKKKYNKLLNNYRFSLSNSPVLYIGGTEIDNNKLKIYMEFILDKFFFNAMQQMILKNNIYFVLINRKAKQICNPNTDIIHHEDNSDYLYELAIPNHPKYNHIKDKCEYFLDQFNRELINECNKLFKTYDHLKSILYNILKLCGSTTSVSNKDKLTINFKCEKLTLSFNITYGSIKSKDINYCIMKEEEKPFIKYPLRLIAEHYSYNILVVDILIEKMPSSNFIITYMNNILLKNIPISFSSYILFMSKNTLMLRNIDIGCPDKVYIKYLYKYNLIYKEYNNILKDTTITKSCKSLNTNSKLYNSLSPQLKNYTQCYTNSEAIFDNIISRYINNSSTINKSIFNNKQDTMIDVLDNEKIFLWLYRILFTNIAYELNRIVNTKIDKHINEIIVYSVTQSIYNSNSENNNFNIGDIYTFESYKSTTLAKDYSEHPRFIGSNIFPVIFKIIINPGELSGQEYLFMNSDQYEIVLNFGSQIKIIDVSRCYTEFIDTQVNLNKYIDDINTIYNNAKDKVYNKLLQNCILITGKLLKNDKISTILSLNESLTGNINCGPIKTEIENKNIEYTNLIYKNINYNM